MHNNSSDSGKIESADDDSSFEPTDGADDDDDDDNNDEGGEIDSYVSANSHDSDLDDDPLALPEEGRRGAPKSRDAVPRKAQ